MFSRSCNLLFTNNPYLFKGDRFKRQDDNIEAALDNTESISSENIKAVQSENQDNKSIWGTFHFIAKSDCTILTNTRESRFGVRAVSPVVDTLMIPKEVLQDIYGGK